MVGEMSLLSPRQPHGSEAVDRCLRHRSRNWPPTTDTIPRNWEVTSDLDGGRGAVLAAGTRLRLDDVSIQVFHENGGWSAADLRFAVLDGPLTGTCWRAKRYDMLDGEFIAGAPVRVVDNPARDQATTFASRREQRARPAGGEQVGRRDRG